MLRVTMEISDNTANKMVRLHVKKGDESQFLYETHVDAMVEDVLYEVTIIYNGRLKILRICYGNQSRENIIIIMLQRRRIVSNRRV
ncbi:cilia- and flagella-associated protein 298 isoform X1 [Vespula maculifrons]|uniref:Cilia- and flagella-associated protein 298 isoform X1 n=1 Tax=Vespula maculifrons TaxID=7453 RepID=A0ABD2B4H1_VESMC